jgi:site-specific DNA-methyltransferase (adenine-specific)
MKIYKPNENITLYHADCQSIFDTLQFDSIVTDPPYGMSFVSNHRKEKHKFIENDDNEELLKWICNVNVNHSKYVFCRWDNIYNVNKPKSLITWVKNNWSMGDLNHEHGRQTETILFYAGEKHFFPNGRPSDVIKAPRTLNNYHPTEKPIQLMHAIIEWTNGVVIDPFMGSGSTAIASIRANRKFIGIEIDENYFEIACNRIKQELQSPMLF